ncbi:hypothetical protein A3Q56_08064, partial [Intoshia linei]
KFLYKNIGVNKVEANSYVPSFNSLLSNLVKNNHNVELDRDVSCNTASRASKAFMEMTSGYKENANGISTSFPKYQLIK